jgi:hypothetical protein
MSCKSRQVSQVYSADTTHLLSIQDTTNKKVTQVISHDTVRFDYSDFYDLKSNKSYDRFLAGQVNLPTGQVVCADPIYRQLAYPQSWTVSKGEYPVYLYIGLKDDLAGRVAYAELVFKDEIPKYWELSIIADDFLKDSFGRIINGMYPVENGLSSFSDHETFMAYEQEIQQFYQLHPGANYYNIVLDKHFQENHNIPESSRGEDWANYKPAKANGNIIMFGSGYGDGLYPRYVGYDKNGQVIKLVTDFTLLNDKTEE